MSVQLEGYDELMVHIKGLGMTKKEGMEIVEPAARAIENQIIEAAFKEADENLNEITYKFKSGTYHFPGHLYDGVTHKASQLWDGGTLVGFKDGYFQLANWVNNGTYVRPGKHFMEKVVSENKERTFELYAIAAREVFKRKGLK